MLIPAPEASSGSTKKIKGGCKVKNIKKSKQLLKQDEFLDREIGGKVSFKSGCFGSSSRREGLGETGTGKWEKEMVLKGKCLNQVLFRTS